MEVYGVERGLGRAGYPISKACFEVSERVAEEPPNNLIDLFSVYLAKFFKHHPVKCLY